MRPAVVTAVLLLVGIINTVTARSKIPWDLLQNNPQRGCEDYDGRNVWISYGGNRCMTYFKDKKTYQEAQEYCQSLDSELLSIRNQADMDNAICLRLSLGGYDLTPFWIGGHKSEGVFKHTDGTEFKYTNWDTNQPDNYGGGPEDCIIANFGDWGKWNDFPCSTKNAFVCMKKK